MKKTHKGFTLSELLVVIAIIGVLIALLAPVITSTRECSQTAVCMNNIKQISLAAFMYADDHDTIIPDVSQTANYAQNNGNIYKCPRDTRAGVGIAKPSYTAWKYTPASLLPASITSSPCESILYVESDLTNKNEIDNVDKLALRHDNRTVVAFVDGHVFSYSQSQLAPLATGIPSEAEPEIPVD